MEAEKRDLWFLGGYKKAVVVLMKWSSVYDSCNMQLFNTEFSVNGTFYPFRAESVSIS